MKKGLIILFLSFRCFSTHASQAGLTSDICQISQFINDNPLVFSDFDKVRFLKDLSTIKSIRIRKITFRGKRVISIKMIVRNIEELEFLLNQYYKNFKGEKDLLKIIEDEYKSKAETRDNYADLNYQIMASTQAEIKAIEGLNSFFDNREKFYGYLDISLLYKNSFQRSIYKMGSEIVDLQFRLMDFTLYQSNTSAIRAQILFKIFNLNQDLKEFDRKNFVLIINS